MESIIFSASENDGPHRAKKSTKIPKHISLIFSDLNKTLNFFHLFVVYRFFVYFCTTFGPSVVQAQMKICELCRILQTFTTSGGLTSKSARMALPNEPPHKISEENAEIDGDQRENVHHMWEELRPLHLQPSLLLPSMQYTWRGSL